MFLIFEEPFGDTVFSISEDYEAAEHMRRILTAATNNAVTIVELEDGEAYQPHTLQEHKVH